MIIPNQSFSDWMKMRETSPAVKIGRVELLEPEAQYLYENKRYIVTSKTILQIYYSKAQKTFSGVKVYHLARPDEQFCKRGRFYTFDAAGVNRLVGFDLLSTEIY